MKVTIDIDQENDEIQPGGELSGTLILVAEEDEVAVAASLNDKTDDDNRKSISKNVLDHISLIGYERTAISWGFNQHRTYRANIKFVDIQLSVTPGRYGISSTSNVKGISCGRHHPRGCIEYNFQFHMKLPLTLPSSLQVDTMGDESLSNYVEIKYQVVAVLRDGAFCTRRSRSSRLLPGFSSCQNNIPSHVYSKIVVLSRKTAAAAPSPVEQRRVGEILGPIQVPVSRSFCGSFWKTRGPIALNYQTNHKDVFQGETILTEVEVCDCGNHNIQWISTQLRQTTKWWTNKAIDVKAPEKEKVMASLLGHDKKIYAAKSQTNLSIQVPHYAYPSFQGHNFSVHHDLIVTLATAGFGRAKLKIPVCILRCGALPAATADKSI